MKSFHCPLGSAKKASLFTLAGEWKDVLEQDWRLPGLSCLSKASGEEDDDTGDALKGRQDCWEGDEYSANGTFAL